MSSLWHLPSSMQHMHHGDLLALWTVPKATSSGMPARESSPLHDNVHLGLVHQVLDPVFHATVSLLLACLMQA